MPHNCIEIYWDGIIGVGLLFFQGDGCTIDYEFLAGFIDNQNWHI